MNKLLDNNKALIGVAIVALIAGFVIAQLLQKPATEQKPAAQKHASLAMPERVVEFSLPDINGKIRNINEWKGKTIILNFWATWCPPCREEVPLLIEVHKKYKKAGLVVVSVAIDKKEDVANFADSYFINYPVLINDQENTQLMAQYGNRVAALPYSVMIDTDGKIIGRRVGAYEKAELYSILEKMFKY